MPAEAKAATEEAPSLAKSVAPGCTPPLKTLDGVYPGMTKSGSLQEEGVFHLRSFVAAKAMNEGMDSL